MNRRLDETLFTSRLPVIDSGAAVRRDRLRQHGASLKSGSRAQRACCRFLSDILREPAPERATVPAAIWRRPSALPPDSWRGSCVWVARWMTTARAASDREMFNISVSLGRRPERQPLDAPGGVWAVIATAGVVFDGRARRHAAVSAARWRHHIPFKMNTICGEDSSDHEAGLRRSTAAAQIVGKGLVLPHCADQLRDTSVRRRKGMIRCSIRYRPDRQRRLACPWHMS